MARTHKSIGKHKYYFKVLRRGRRPTVASFARPWPKVGVWTELRSPSMCLEGWHLTTFRGLPRWAGFLFRTYGRIDDYAVYVAEIDLAGRGYFQSTTDHYKICVPRARLVRRLPVTKALREKLSQLTGDYSRGRRQREQQALRYLATFWGFKPECGIFR